uniref:Putative lactosylceramide 4-alpha-galactosyltransferase-like n=1 Tax=Davidia involucrata TaxID=16924 RepID=A0A5B7BXW0_DAVIN
MFDLGRVKLFSTICLTAIFLVILIADSLISNLSLHSVAFGSKRNPQQELQSTHEKLKPTSTHEPLLLVKEEVEESYGSELVAPFNVTGEERIAWFKRKFGEFEILKSTRLTRQFESRVVEFLGNGGYSRCEIQFFMTWISPARSFRGREFWAVESVFKAHPHGCLTILSTSMDSVGGYRILKPLLDRGFRVFAVTPDLPFLFKDTPAEGWFNDIKSGNKDPGEIPLAQNLSNLIRLAILYKYGGVYLDTDFIVLKDFSGLRNSIGAQSIDVSGSWTRLNNAVLVFDKNHPLVYKFIEEFASTFDGNKWGHNGPYLVSRVATRTRSRSSHEYNYTVLPPLAFYPVGWNRIAGFFVEPNTRHLAKWVEDKLLQLSGGPTYGVHLWNKQSSRLRIEEGSIIGRLILDHCVICQHIYTTTSTS